MSIKKNIISIFLILYLIMIIKFYIYHHLRKFLKPSIYNLYLLNNNHRKKNKSKNGLLKI